MINLEFLLRIANRVDSKANANAVVGVDYPCFYCSV